MAIAGGLFLALGAGVGALAGVKMAAGKDKTVTLHAKGFSLAAKALLYGTALAWGTAAVAVAVTAKVMGVTTMREFGDRMREKVPQQTEGTRRTMRAFKGWLEERMQWAKRSKD